MSAIAHKHLQNMGFTEKEAKVYMTCLKSGPCTVKQLADDCGVKRPTTYVMLQSLMEKELVELVKRGKKTFFAAHHPNALRKHVERERQALAKKDAILDELMPMLMPMASETVAQAA
jgi:sugar-specific transcriptional regulator TrmB